MKNKLLYLTSLLSLTCCLASESHAALTMNIDPETEEFYFTGSDTGTPESYGGFAWSSAGWVDASDFKNFNGNDLFNFSAGDSNPMVDFAVVSSGVELSVWVGTSTSVTVTGKGSSHKESYSHLDSTAKNVLENTNSLPVEDGSGFSPLAIQTVSSIDSDEDGLSDSEESSLGTNPNNPDSDGDGFSDGFEVTNGYGPLDSSDPDTKLIEYIRENGDSFNLYPSNAVFNIAVGELLVSCSNQTAQLQIQLEQSEDLLAWTNAADAVQWSLPIGSDKKFFKVKAQK